MMELVIKKVVHLDWADNYDSLATIDDGLCELNACMSDWADNYDVNAT